MQRSKAPLIAVVRLRKGNHWVLPKGKLNNGETARAAAEREVVEETGHDVSVHEFLGTLAYEASGGRPKIVHFWRMEAEGEQTRKLMADVKAVAWLPLDKAVERLTRGHEQAFLANVGPLALETSAARAVPAPRRASKPVAAKASPERKGTMIEKTATEQPATGQLPAVVVDTAEVDIVSAASAPSSGSHDLVVVQRPPQRQQGLLWRLWGWLQRKT